MSLAWRVSAAILLGGLRDRDVDCLGRGAEQAQESGELRRSTDDFNSHLGLPCPIAEAATTCHPAGASTTTTGAGAPITMEAVEPQRANQKLSASPQPQTGLLRFARNDGAKTTILSGRYPDIRQPIDRLEIFSFAEIDYGLFFLHPAPMKGDAHSSARRGGMRRVRRGAGPVRVR